MVDSIQEVINSIEHPVELMQKVGLLFAIFCLGALFSRLSLGKVCHALSHGKVLPLVWTHIATPSMCLGGFASVFTALRYVDFPEGMTPYYILLSIRVLALFCLLLLFLRLLDSALAIAHDKLSSQSKPIPVSLFFFGRFFKGLLTIIFIAAIVPSLFFGYDAVNTLVKYIGVSTISAGAIAGLALQPAVKDILGGLFVITQNLFTEGDWIEFNVGRRIVSGRVVDVALRYTRLKRWTGSFFMVPNNTFLSSVLDNYGRAHYTSYAVPLTASQKGKLEVARFIAGYQDLIQASPYIEDERCHVTVKSLNVGKMEVELHIFFTKATDQDKVVRIHAFWQDILHLAKKLKLSVDST